MEKIDFTYELDDERLIAYSRLTPLERLRWLDELRRFTLLARAAPKVALGDAAAGQGAPGSAPAGKP